jgi:(p)ppGpp synthase/HD superfamily hydrolase
LTEQPDRGRGAPALAAPPQTNIRLYAVLAEAGYPDADVGHVRTSYELAVRLFTSQFRASGKPFLAHVVGTSGIMALLGAPRVLLEAGLLHAAYTHGDFGTGMVGVSDAKRREVRQMVGEEVEGLIAAYSGLPWTERTLKSLQSRLPSLSNTDRSILRVRLANELEDHVDLGIRYGHDAEHRRHLIRAWLHRCVDLADELGEPRLARALAHAFQQCLAAEVHASLVTTEIASYTVPPRSYRPHVGARLRRALWRHISR